MKIINLLVALPAIALTTGGCVQSHRSEAAHTPTPAVVPAAPAPTSNRPETRAYPEGSVQTVTPPSTPPPGVSSSDVALATQVSEWLKGDPTLASASRNVQVTVHQGVVTLHGMVPSEHQRFEIVNRLSRLPGVKGIEDDLGVTYR